MTKKKAGLSAIALAAFATTSYMALTAEFDETVRGAFTGYFFQAGQAAPVVWMDRIELDTGDKKAFFDIDYSGHIQVLDINPDKPLAETFRLLQIKSGSYLPAEDDRYLKSPYIKAGHPVVLERSATLWDKYFQNEKPAGYKIVSPQI